MPRPFKMRKVCCCPESDYFKPRGIPLRELEEVSLGMDELEAMRLADVEGLYHVAAAKRMKISRQTFGNILKSAHRKMAGALLRGQALKIEKGKAAS